MITLERLRKFSPMTHTRASLLGRICTVVARATSGTTTPDMAGEGTIPSVFNLMYLQAHRLDLKFYDTFFTPGSYLDTHRRQMELWHS
jgi:hypothetical protein